MKNENPFSKMFFFQGLFFAMKILSVKFRIIAAHKMSTQSNSDI